MRLDGRRFLVTGATSGIGAATVRAIVDGGGRVAVMARTTGDVEAAVDALGDAAVAAPGDVSDPVSTAAAVSVAVAALGGLDGVIASAGVVTPGGIVDTQPVHWRSMFEVNALGVLNTVHAALPHLSDPSDVVVVSSMSGRRRASVAMGIYSATKSAVHVIADSLREELAPRGVRVTTISPGYVDTPIFDHLDDDEQRATYRQRVADMGLAPEAVADQIVHVITRPPEVRLVEVAFQSTTQP